MDASILETFAELSIGLVGFAGVVSVLGRSKLHVETRAFRVKALLLYSTTALGGSILPMVLEKFSLNHTSVWVASSIVIALAIAGIFSWFALTINSLTDGGHLPRPLAWSLGFTLVLVIVLLIYGIVFARGHIDAIYLIALCWALGMGLFHFCMLVLSIQLEGEST